MPSTVWKGHITFGLVSFPVKLYSAARGESVSFHQLHKTDGSRVKQVLYCRAEDKPISRDEIVKGFEYEDDKYVVIEDEDLKKAAPKTAKVVEILEFVKSAEVDPVYYDASYYVAPDDAGERPYALLFEALKKTGYAGVAQVAMHNREHTVVLRPGAHGILMHTMYYAAEVNRNEEFRTNTSSVKDKELELAKMLIESLASSFEPQKYKDSYRENVLAMIEAKRQGKEIVEAPAPQPGKVVDILDALKKSLAVKKPPATAASARPSAATAPHESEKKPKRTRKAS